MGTRPRRSRPACRQRRDSLRLLQRLDHVGPARVLRVVLGASAVVTTTAGSRPVGQSCTAPRSHHRCSRLTILLRYPVVGHPQRSDAGALAARRASRSCSSFGLSSPVIESHMVNEAIMSAWVNSSAAEPVTTSESATHFSITLCLALLVGGDLVPRRGVAPALARPRLGALDHPGQRQPQLGRVLGERAAQRGDLVAALASVCSNWKNFIRRQTASSGISSAWLVISHSEHSGVKEISSRPYGSRPVMRVAAGELLELRRVQVGLHRRLGEGQHPVADDRGVAELRVALVAEQQVVVLSPCRTGRPP